MNNFWKIAIAAGLGAAAWYGYKIYTVIKNLDVNFSSLKVHKIDKNGINLTVGVEFDNTEGRSAFTCNGLRLRVYLDGSKVAEVNENDSFKIAAYSTEKMEYSMSISWSELGTNIVNIIRNFDEKIKVGVKGVVYVNKIPVTIGEDQVTEFKVSQELDNLKGEIENVINNISDAKDAITDIISLFKKKDNKEESKVSGLGKMNIQ